MDATMQSDALLARIDALSTQVAWLVERQRKQEELFDELLLPVAREAMKTTTSRLDELEKKGYFAFGEELLKVGQRIVESYSPEDVRALGGAITTILDTVRAVTQPEVLSVVGEASQVIAHAGETQPIGLVGMVRATHHQDVQRGMAVLMELLGKLGKGAAVLTQKQTESEQRKARLAAALGPRRNRTVLGVERRPAPTVSPVERPAATPKTIALKPTTTIDGYEFTAEGHLVDPTRWNRELAITLAKLSGIALTNDHWAVIDFARRDWEGTKQSPNIRRITQQMDLQTKDLYALFPKAPGRTIAKIAGIPKPVGCI